MKTLVQKIIVAGALVLALTTHAQPVSSIGGTYYLQSMMEGGLPSAPFPFDPYHGALPIATLNAAQHLYLIQDTPQDYADLQTFNQMAKTKSFGMSPMDDSGPPIPGGGDGTNDIPPFTNTFSFDTNGLYLQISNVADGMAYVNLVHATDYVYEVWSKQTLSASNWDIADEIFPTDTNIMPFAVAQSARTNLFLWARDWTGITSEGNTIPEWWLYLYFGADGLSLLDTNLDSSGNSLLSDYQNDLDPNIISFWIQVTNNYVSNMSAPVQLNVTAGSPAEIAVSVDDTNYAADATWNPYTSSDIAVDLGLTAGWHDVWIGLKGPAPNATVTWQWAHLNLTLPPVLAITSPAAVVDEPMIQIYGYCQESLAAISYDISNAAGVFTDQPSEITDRYYDTNIFDFTTNYFECLDVSLTNGLNTITVHATNLTGDTTTTNFNFTLDYSGKTNPPAVQVAWPQSGAQISGGNFTFRGWISDPTATVTTQLLSTNSGVVSTNSYSAEVERNGNFWLENLPLNAGTNLFTITVKDIVGNTTTTNITVVQSPLVFTINPVTDFQGQTLWNPVVYVTGTISDPTYAIWINGVKGHNLGNGTWVGENVPVNSGGTAIFTATAYAPDEQQPDGSYGN